MNMTKKAYNKILVKRAQMGILAAKFEKAMALGNRQIEKIAYDDAMRQVCYHKAMDLVSAIKNQRRYQ